MFLSLVGKSVSCLLAGEAPACSSNFLPARQSVLKRLSSAHSSPELKLEAQLKLLREASAGKPNQLRIFVPRICKKG